MANDYMSEICEKTIEYCNYINEHQGNVIKAWEELQRKSKNDEVISTLFQHKKVFDVVDEDIRNHDMSKFSKEEFIPYRINFHFCKNEEKDQKAFDEAWKHHYENNPHHWNYWVNSDGSFKEGNFKHHKLCSYIHMVCDWQGMGYKFGGDSLSWYMENKHKIKIDPNYIEFVEYLLHVLCD